MSCVYTVSNFSLINIIVVIVIYYCCKHWCFVFLINYKIHIIKGELENYIFKISQLNFYSPLFACDKP